MKRGAGAGTPGREGRDQMQRMESDQPRRMIAGIAVVFAAMLATTPNAARAQTGASAPLRVTINHAEVIQLQAAAALALIADPDIADIVNERNNLVFVLGRKPGATNLLVYDNRGQRLLDREVLVVPDAKTMVTITRETDVTRYFCEPHCVFYEHEQRSAPPAPPANAPLSPGAANAGASQAGQPPPNMTPGGG